MSTLLTLGYHIVLIPLDKNTRAASILSPSFDSFYNSYMFVLSKMSDMPNKNGLACGAVK